MEALLIVAIVIALLIVWSEAGRDIERVVRETRRSQRSRISRRRTPKLHLPPPTDPESVATKVAKLSAKLDESERNGEQERRAVDR